MTIFRPLLITRLVIEAEIEEQRTVKLRLTPLDFLRDDTEEIPPLFFQLAGTADAAVILIHTLVLVHRWVAVGDAPTTWLALLRRHWMLES